MQPGKRRLMNVDRRTANGWISSLGPFGKKQKKASADNKGLVACDKCPFLYFWFVSDDTKAISGFFFTHNARASHTNASTWPRLNKLFLKEEVVFRLEVVSRTPAEVMPVP